ncbi:MAG: hypothetical protein Q8N77_00115 [Nanoarchaeota archaeon]|nr:hypothetical protein [Nanoarchaeota archaeon]
MKKLKTLCAIVGAAAMLYTAPAFATEQKFNVPEYDLKGAEEITSYSVLTPFGLLPIQDPKEAEGSPVVITKKYGVDRNKDGKSDLIYIEVNVPELEYTNPQTGKPVKEPAYTVKQLAIDEDFDGYVERLLIDQQDEKEKNGADGIYDLEQYAPRIEDLLK